MQIVVLAVPECPNLPVLVERVHAALIGRTHAVEVIEVSRVEQARLLGMTGSPTLLINGADPFATPGTPASLSCRLYRTPGGAVAGAPELSDLQRVLLAEPHP